MPNSNNSFWDAFKTGYRNKSPSASYLDAFVKGGRSAITPYEPMPELFKSPQEIATREFEIRSLKAGQNLSSEVQGLSLWEKFSTKQTRRMTRFITKFASKYAGPAITGYRLATELDLSEGVAASTIKAGRITGEEVITTGAVAAGMLFGGKVGAGIGAALGSFIAPGVGSAIGGVAGFLVGAGIGMLGSAVGGWAWNKFMDVAELPVRAWNFLRETGRNSNRLELGGMTSIANSSRQAYTMRARALQDMNRSGINARSLLGQEASYMHIR